MVRSRTVAMVHPIGLVVLVVGGEVLERQQGLDVSRILPTALGQRAPNSWAKASTARSA